MTLRNLINESKHNLGKGLLPRPWFSGIFCPHILPPAASCEELSGAVHHSLGGAAEALSLTRSSPSTKAFSPPSGSS